MVSGKQQGDKIAYTDGDKGGDKAGQLEGVVDDILAHMGSARAVKLQRGNLWAGRNSR